MREIVHIRMDVCCHGVPLGQCPKCPCPRACNPPYEHNMTHGHTWYTCNQCNVVWDADGSPLNGEEFTELDQVGVLSRSWALGA